MQRPGKVANQGLQDKFVIVAAVCGRKDVVLSTPEFEGFFAEFALDIGRQDKTLVMKSNL